MDSENIVCLSTLILVSIIFSVESFKIKECNNQIEEKNISEDVEMWCKSDERFGYCKLTNKETKESCQYTIQQSKKNYEAIQDSKCNFKDRLEFTGHIEGFVCKFKLNQLTSDDNGLWEIKMWSWSWSGIYKSDSKDFNLNVIKRNKETSSTRLDGTFPTSVESLTSSDTCYENNTDYKSKDLHSAPANSSESCQKLCKEYLTCHVWTFKKKKMIKDENDCYLKDALALNGRVINSNTISGQKRCPGCFLFGVSITGTQQQNDHTSPSECQKSCKDKAECQLFQWYPLERVCYFILNINDAIETKANAILGLPNCDDYSTSLHLENNKIKIVGPSNQNEIQKTPASTPQTTSDGINSKDQNSTGSAEQNKTNIVGPSVGAVLVLLAIFGGIAIFILLKKRKSNQENRIEMEETKPSLNNLRSQDKKETETKKPLPTETFAQCVRDLEYPDQHEYSRLNIADQKLNVMRLSDSDAKKYSQPIERPMNRYANTIPYNHNRVVLKNPVDGCDYINASWITNEIETIGEPTFIVTQGPMQHTIPHFLQMIMDHKVKVIIMLTKLKEGDQGSEIEKCARYWPGNKGSNVKFEHLEVSLKSETKLSNIDNTIMRVFEIRDISRNESYGPIYQYQFNAWPDFGVPDLCKPIVDLAKSLKFKLKDFKDSANVVVHCSAGVGRSGTFLALYKLMSKIDSGDAVPTIDVYNQVFQLRRDRCCMVQKVEQYHFLYACVASYLSPEEDPNQDYIYTLYQSDYYLTNLEDSSRPPSNVLI